MSAVRDRVSKVEKWKWECEECGILRDAYTTGHGALVAAKRHNDEKHGGAPVESGQDYYS